MTDKQQFIVFFTSMGIRFEETEPFEEETSYISVGQTHFYFSEDNKYTHLIWDEMGVVEKRGEEVNNND